jgi:hypothetical protein
MRTDARREARLVTHLRAEFGVEVAAARMARLLVGPDRSPIQTALLWWSARPCVTATEVPEDVRSRWRRDLRAADTAAALLAAEAATDAAPIGCRESGTGTGVVRIPDVAPVRVNGSAAEGW